MATATVPRRRGRARATIGCRPSARVSAALPADLALVAVRTALAWIFIWYGAGKLFGAFNGPGLHQSALFFSNTAHLRPGGFFAVLGGVIEFGGGISLSSRARCSPRRTCLVRRHGHGDDHRHLGERHQFGVADPGLRLEHGARRAGSGCRGVRRRSIQHRRPRRTALGKLEA